MKETIKWKPLIIGIGIALIYYFISGDALSVLPFLLAGIAVGYMVGIDIKIGAINGALLGAIGGLIVILALTIMVYLQTGGLQILGYLVNQFVIYLIIDIVMAVIGGVIGSLVRAEVEKS
ncbi:MAG: DUF5518 domain-containing protein [Methanobacterium sp.]|uniref:DUF5518 domain-containing protein n=1 Tax=Methanobacterium sp. TaxID=2164 RepID=UPI003D64EDB1|nr:DUF5518 domain-containing protein [Methanobacterium sp.]